MEKNLYMHFQRQITDLINVITFVSLLNAASLFEALETYIVCPKKKMNGKQLIGVETF